MLNKDEQPVPMRLQRFLARAGVASRRGSETLMTAGRVRVNGVVVTELGSKVDPLKDIVEVDGHRCSLADSPVFLMLNKPAGYLTTMHDPQGRPCVASLVPTKQYPGLFPVGRLDKDTTGLLLFTTDGKIGQQLLHPSHHARKHYVALVKGRVFDEELVPLRLGIVLDDGPCQPSPAEILPQKSSYARSVKAQNFDDKNYSVIGITLHEGRKHQVKRMLEAIGHPVVRLHRDTFGPLQLGDLSRGSWRELSDSEIKRILSHQKGSYATVSHIKRGERA